MSYSLIDLDALEFSSAEQTLAGGWMITRVAHVQVLNDDGTPYTLWKSSADQFSFAVYALATIVGGRGSTCPDLMTTDKGGNLVKDANGNTALAPAILEQFIPEAIAPEQVRIKIVYRGLPIATYEVQSVLTQIPTNKDANGKPAIVTYTYPADYPDRTRRGKPFKQNAIVSANVPESVHVLRFPVMDIPGGLSAIQQVQLLTASEGYVNDRQYTVGAQTGAPRTWLVERVEAVTRNGCLTYEVAVYFHYRPITWDVPAIYMEPLTGLPPADAMDQPAAHIMIQERPAMSLPIPRFLAN
jgi:hypothetical protein